LNRKSKKRKKEKPKKRAVMACALLLSSAGLQRNMALIFPALPVKAPVSTAESQNGTSSATSNKVRQHERLPDPSRDNNNRSAEVAFPNPLNPRRLHHRLNSRVMLNGLQ